MFKKTYLFLTLLTALLLGGTGLAWGVQLNESFDGTTFAPEGWTVEKTKGTVNWARSTSSKHTGAASAYAKYGPSTGNDTYLITPKLAPASGESLSFWLYAQYSNYQTTIQVEVSTSTNAASSFSSVIGTYISCSTGDNSFASTWKNFTIDLSSYVGQEIYIAFHAIDADGNNVYLDDVSGVTLKQEGCPKPKALNQTAISATSSTFTWNQGGSEEAWQWVCLPAADDLDWTGAATVTSATATVSGLEASHDYKFYVRADCSSEQSEEASKAFTTACAGYATANLPFEENFNTATSTGYVLPGCWTRVAYVSGSNYYPYTYGSSGVDGSKCIRFYGGSSTSEQIAILPPFEAATNTLVLSLAYKYASSQTYYGTIKIGYMTNPNDASTFQSLKELTTRSTTFNSDAVNKFALTGAPENSYIAIKYSGGSSIGTVYIDNVKVALPSSCTDPSDVNAVATSTATATVSWTENGSAEAWNIQYSTDNFATHTDINNVTDNPYPLTGLAANTTYKVRVQAVCEGGDKSDWITSASSFSTPCEAINGIGWSEDFEAETAGSGKIPDCWQKITNNNSYPQISSTASYQKTGSTKCLYFYGGITGSSEQIAILPPFTEATNTLYVTLDYNNAYYDSYWGETYDYSGDNYGQLSIGYVINSTFTPQESLPRVSAYATASVALTNAPVGSYVAIRYSGGSSAGYLFVDNISISAIPSCVAPSNVNGAATASDKISVSWTANSGESAWKIQYSSDNGENWSAEIDANTNPFTLTELSANTDYIVQVKALCGGEDVSGWSASSAPIHTPCGAADASDYSETMENATAAVGHLPDCWQYREKYSTGYPYVYSYAYYAYAGNNCLYFQGGVDESSEQSVLLPEMDQPLNNLTLEFYYKDAESAWSTLAKFTVGYIAADGTTFVPIETLNYADSYTKYTKDLSALPADAKCLAIRFAGGEYSAYGYIDNVRVYPTPTCAAPTGVTVSNVTATTAQVAWTENNSATAWSLQLSNDGSTWGDAISVSANPYQLTGLTPNHTTYYVRVNSVCGGTDASPYSEASAPFQTECETRSMPFSENFNGLTAGIPTCWDNSEGTTATASYKWNYYATGHEGKGVRFDSYNNSGNNTNTLKTPAITISEAAMLVFWYKNPAGGDLSIYYSIDGVKQVAPLASGLTGKTDWTQASFNLPNTCVDHEVVIMFQGTSNYGNGDAYIYLDDVQVIEQPACPAVNATTLAVSNVTAHTATVSWTAGEETAWNLQYKAAGGEWSSVIPVTASSYDLTGLAENTLYYVRVQANCGDATSEWTGDEAFSFRTDCDPKAVSKASPWNYGFEDAADDAFPACWDRNEAYSGHGYPIVNEDSYNANTGDKYLYFYTPARNGGPAYTEDAILPVFNTDIKNLKVSFVYKNNSTGTNYGQLAVGYVSGNEFVQVGDLLAKVDDYTSVEREMPNNAPEGARIAIRCIGSTKSGYSTYVYVDDIVVSLKPTCYTPTNLAAAETSDGAVLTWTAGKDENEWNVRYSVKDADEWTVVDEIVAANYTLTGLTAGTYEVQVKAVCGVGEESDWSASVEFSPACNAPSALAVTACTGNSATFSWTSNESAFVLQYSADGETWLSENVAANPFTLEGLAAGTTYQAKIQSACGSDFSNVVEFTTWCALANANELPLNEDFSAGAKPDCWQFISATEYPTIASEKLWFQGNNEQIAVLPGFNINLSQLHVSFDFTANNASIELGYYAANGGAFQSLGAVTSGEDVDLSTKSAPAEAGYLAIRYYGATETWATGSVDNVRVYRQLVLADNVDNRETLVANNGKTLDVVIGRTFTRNYGEDTNPDHYNTICLPFSLSAEELAASPIASNDLWAFKYAKVDEATNELQFRIVEADHIEAGKPYFIGFPANEENIVNPLFKNVTITASAGQNVGDAVAQLCGILKPETFYKGDQKKLFLYTQTNTLYWWNGSADSQLNGFRAFFYVPGNSDSNGAPIRFNMSARIVKEEQTATGIENTTLNENGTMKVLENNQVVIIRNGVKYTLQGQKIQ